MQYVAREPIWHSLLQQEFKPGDEIPLDHLDMETIHRLVEQQVVVAMESYYQAFWHVVQEAFDSVWPNLSDAKRVELAHSLGLTGIRTANAEEYRERIRAALAQLPPMQPTETPMAAAQTALDPIRTDTEE